MWVSNMFMASLDVMPDGIPAWRKYCSPVIMLTDVLGDALPDPLFGP
jgi:hypothetical protein